MAEYDMLLWSYGRTFHARTHRSPTGSTTFFLIKCSVSRRPAFVRNWKWFLNIEPHRIDGVMRTSAWLLAAWVENFPTSFPRCFRHFLGDSAYTRCRVAVLGVWKYCVQLMKDLLCAGYGEEFDICQSTNGQITGRKRPHSDKVNRWHFSFGNFLWLGISFALVDAVGLCQNH